MFPTSKIACTVQVGRNRLKYIVNFGLASYFKDILKSEIAASEWFLISFDESSNKEIQDFEMNFVIHFWNSAINKVHFRFWDSMFFGCTTAKDSAKNFCYGLSWLDLLFVERFSCALCGLSFNLLLRRLSSQLFGFHQSDEKKCVSGCMCSCFVRFLNFRTLV